MRDVRSHHSLCPCTTQAVDMMNLARFQPVVLGLLYHISIEDKFKSLFTYTECIPRMYEMLTRVEVRGAGVGVCGITSWSPPHGQKRCKDRFLGWAGMSCVAGLEQVFEQLVRKIALAHTRCAPHPQDLRNTPELIALAVNLTQNGRNAEVGELRMQARLAAVLTLLHSLIAIPLAPPPSIHALPAGHVRGRPLRPPHSPRFPDVR